MPTCNVKSVYEAIDRTNELPYGLVAYAFINSAERPSDGVEVNSLSIDHRGKATAET